MTLVSCANTNRLYDQSVYHSENDKEYQFSVFNRTNNESMIDTMLSSACMTNDLDTIDLIITERPNIKSEVFKKGPASKISTCLVYALNSRKVTLPTVKYLVEKGSGVNSYVE
ncbi:hypothetical protein, partial [Oleiphilus sp. HI0132]|uniref:hypothetical protein n=2 Tax=Oleiphilus sp. HI0132 TaxID=1822270 RepID=UPI001E53FC3F